MLKYKIWIQLFPMNSMFMHCVYGDTIQVKVVVFYLPNYISGTTSLLHS
jgi:hypothetical protein